MVTVPHQSSNVTQAPSWPAGTSGSRWRWAASVISAALAATRLGVNAAMSVRR